MLVHVPTLQHARPFFACSPQKGHRSAKLGKEKGSWAPGSWPRASARGIRTAAPPVGTALRMNGHLTFAIDVAMVPWPMRRLGLYHPWGHLEGQAALYIYVTRAH